MLLPWLVQLALPSWLTWLFLAVAAVVVLYTRLGGHHVRLS